MAEHKMSLVEHTLKKHNAVVDNRIKERSDFITNAYRHGFHVGAVKAAQEKGIKVKSFDDLTTEQLRDLHPQIVDHAINHLDDAVLNYFLEKPQFKGDPEMQKQLRGSMYKVLFGNEAIIGDGENRQKIEMGQDYFRHLFGQGFANSDGKNLSMSHLERGLETSGVAREIENKSLYDFGRGLNFEKHRSTFLSYLGVEDIVAEERIPDQKAFDDLVKKLGRKRVSEGSNYDSNATKQIIRDKAPHLVNDAVYKHEFKQTKKDAEQQMYQRKAM